MLLHHCVRLPLVLALCLSSGAALAGDDDKIATDRPDFVESAEVVGKGRVQLETSFAYSRHHWNGATTHESSTPSLLRVGISDVLELRAETDGRMRSRLSPGGVERGWADTSLGLKWHIADAEGGRPSMALLFHVDLDNGSEAFRGHGKRPSVRLTNEWELPHDMSLGLMVGLERDINERGTRFNSALYGIVLGKQWNERWRSFVELAQPTIARAEHGSTTASFDIGAAYLLNKSVQIDTALSHGLNDHTPEWRWTVGVSVKF